MRLRDTHTFLSTKNGKSEASTGPRVQVALGRLRKNPNCPSATSMRTEQFCGSFIDIDLDLLFINYLKELNCSCIVLVEPHYNTTLLDDLLIKMKYN